MGDFQLTIDTPRLILRPLMQEDAEQLFEMDSDPAVAKYVGGEPVESIDEVKGYITAINNQYKQYGTGRLAVVEKESGKVIGWAGIKYYEHEGECGRSNYYDIGYRLNAKYWGNGYASEASAAMVKHGFLNMGLTKICGVATTAHTASCRILEKLGFRLTEVCIDQDNQSDNWYELTAEEYKTK